MLNATLTYLGAGIIILWGIAHIIPTRGVVAGFGDLTRDNRLIITMEWAAEGMALAFIGILVLLVQLFGKVPNPTAALVFRLSAAMLVVMAVWTGVTGARTVIVPIKICPFVKTLCAALIFIGTMI